MQETELDPSYSIPIPNKTRNAGRPYVFASLGTTKWRLFVKITTSNSFFDHLDKFLGLIVSSLPYRSRGASCLQSQCWDSWVRASCVVSKQWPTNYCWHLAACCGLNNPNLRFLHSSLTLQPHGKEHVLYLLSIFHFVGHLVSSETPNSIRSDAAKQIFLSYCDRQSEAWIGRCVRKATPPLQARLESQVECEGRRYNQNVDNWWNLLIWNVFLKIYINVCRMR